MNRRSILENGAHVRKRTTAPLPVFSMGRMGWSGGPKRVVFGVVDFALLHVEEADQATRAITGGFKDDRRGGAHGAAEDTIPDLEWLAVAFADDELVECVWINADAAQFLRRVFVEERFEFGFVGWAAPVVLRLKREIKIRQALHVRSINAGDRRVGVAA